MLKRTKPSHLFSRPLLALTLLFFLHGGHNACAQTAPTPGETLFLTWHDDPTTTMVAQWLDLGRLPAAMPGTSANASIALPKLPDTLHMDGHGEDWGTQGLRLDYLAQANGQWPDPTGFLATAKLGWTSKGLAVLVHVLDDEATESPNDEALWEADSIELFLGQGLGRSRALQIVLAPGIDPEHPKIRAQTLALAPRRMPQDLVVQAAAVKTEQGYTLEALIPWSNLPEINPKLNATFAFQLMINDVDGPFEKETFTWYPDTNSYANRHAMHTLRLAQEPDTTVRLMVKPRLDEELNQIVLDLGGEPRLIGETVTVQSGSKKLGSVTLENVLGFAGAVMPLPTDAQGTVPRVDAITVQLDDRIIARNLLPNSIWYVDPTPQAATVQLTTPTQTDPLAYASEAVPFGQTGWYVHRVSLTGLSPDTEYHLAVPDGVEKEDIQVKFKTAPATLDQPLVFAEGGDVGTSDAVPLLHNQAAAWDPLFGFVGGDCAYANGVKPKKWLAFLKHWHDNMVTAEGRMIPMLAIIGNHEVDGSFGKTKENAPFFYALFGPLYPNKGTYQTLDFGDYLSLFMLDSGHTAKHSGQQTKWLSKALADRPDVLHRFAAYHVPAYPAHRPYETHHSASARTHWVPLFEEHQIDAVFEHHDHAYKRTHLLRGDQPHPQGILFLGDGAWGVEPRSVDPTRPYLAVAKSSRNVIRVELSPAGTQSYLAVNELGEELDRYPEVATPNSTAPEKTPRHADEPVLTP